MSARWLLALLALGAGCARVRRARHHRTAAREVDPRAQNATACVDPRFVATARVALPRSGRVTDVAVAGGGGRRFVAWVDDRGAHAWDFGARHALAGRALCDEPARAARAAMRWARPDPCAASGPVARGGGRSAALAVAETGGGDALFATVTTSGGRRLAPQQLSVRWAQGERASVVWDGGAFVVAWSEPIHGAAPRAYLALVDRDGRRMGSAMRVEVEPGVGLSQARVAAAGPDLLVAALRDDGGVELRESGPRGCDEPLLPQPPAVPELDGGDGGL